MYQQKSEDILTNSCKISVIVPVYNVENYLSRCLDSLISQTLRDIEIICVNDGSTDKSLVILRDYAQKDSRIKVINQENTGVSVARNNALEVAIGEFIGFVDSDDWVSPDFYENLYNGAVENNAEIACSNIIKTFENKKESNFLMYKKMQVSETISDKLEVARIPEFNYIWNRIYKREALIKNNIKFLESNLFEDALFSLKALTLLGKMVTVKKGAYYYFDNKNSLTNNSNLLKTDFLKNCRRIREYIQENHLVWKFLNIYPYYRKDVIKIFGIPTIVVKKNFVVDKIYLFGFIKIAEITHVKRY